MASIKTLSGHQPMGFDDTWVTFNGEIYDYRKLAREYLKDVPLQTHSDTEVIVQLYRKLGPRAVELMDGMFAFGLIQGDEFFMARDPLEIKPLYCGERDGKFYFASEIKSLTPMTDEIREFPAGHWYHSKTGWHAFYGVSPVMMEIKEEAQAIQAIRAAPACSINEITACPTKKPYTITGYCMSIIRINGYFPQ